EPVSMDGGSAEVLTPSAWMPKKLFKRACALYPKLQAGAVLGERVHIEGQGAGSTLVQRGALLGRRGIQVEKLHWQLEPVKHRVPTVLETEEHVRVFGSKEKEHTQEGTHLSVTTHTPLVEADTID